MPSKPGTKDISPAEAASQLSKDAYANIRKLIFLDGIRPGQSVSAKGLAEQYSISLTPVVQALKILEHNKILRHEPNRGFFVEKISAKEVDEVYRLREMIELSLVPDIIKNMDKKKEKALKTALDQYFNAVDSKPIKVRLACDIHFHMTMAGLSGQSISVWILRHLFDLLYLRCDNDLRSYRPGDASGKEHQAIYDAVISRDVKGTCEIVGRHIRTIRKGMVNGMDEMTVEISDLNF